MKLIALIQISSCAVQRVVSSQMMKVIKAVGNVYEDTLEVRMFARCNGDLIDLWSEAYDSN